MNNEDNELVTKGYLKSELKGIREDMAGMATKNDLVLLEERLAVTIEKSFNHYMGIYMEAMDDKFQLFFEGYADVPEKVRVLGERYQENEDEHRMFDTRIKMLETSA